MKLFNSKKKILVFISIVVIVAALFIACGTSTGGKTFVWRDKLEPEEPEEIAVTSPAVTLPEKPAAAPTTDKTKTTEFGTAIVSDECYTLDLKAEDGLFTVSYKSSRPLTAYAYAYVPVTNYDGNAYLKIKANCESVERLTVLAVYYEQYEQSRPAVVVYNNSVMDGANTFICELENGVVLNSVYGAVLSESLTEKTICGFMLMIDSNPKQIVDEYSGKFTVTEIAVTDENDSDLNKLYAAPYISSWKAGEGFGSCNITTTRQETTDCLDAEIEYSVIESKFPRIEAGISNYKSSYTTVKMDIKGANVKTLTIALKYSLKSSSANIDYNYLSTFDMAVTEDWSAYEFDFSTLEELKDWNNNTVPGSYVKNLRPTAIYFFVDGGVANSGTLSVRNVSFIKDEEGGAPRVTSTWTLGASGISKGSDIAEGGMGTLTYDKWQGWNAVTINVAAYNPEHSVLVVRVKFYSEYSNLGVALGYGSANTVILQSAGMTVPEGWGITLVDHTEEKGEDDSGEYTFHTFEIDFSNATTAASGSELLAQQAITKIMLYIDSAAQTGSGSWMYPSAGTAMKPERQMQFVGIEFKKPQN